jgi:hypothetical protein
MHSPARLIPQSSPLTPILATAHDIPDQPLAAVQAAHGRRWRERHGTILCFISPLCRQPEDLHARPVQARLYQRPAAPDPMAVAAVDELVGASGEATLGCVLPGREPGEEAWDIEISRSKTVSVPSKLVCFEGLRVICGLGFRRDRYQYEPIKYTYFGIMTCGSPMMHKHARAQKAYPPCASESGCSAMPPSNV